MKWTADSAHGQNLMIVPFFEERAISQRMLESNVKHVPCRRIDVRNVKTVREHRMSSAPLRRMQRCKPPKITL